ncbi:MAG: hypothetical protein CMH54_09500 [Myxococcales bacterium]|nr:hypothetical protein [Myxococcales bacterium]|tara:strand:- start:756 stop:1385 length:630 start_codon:yes stop_codon:yes gene_type:complete
MKALRFLAILLLFIPFACSEGDDGVAGDATGEPDVEQVNTFTPIEGGPDCQFDEELRGKDVGDHIKNFSLKKPDDTFYWMHEACGYGKKVVWMILATGHCGTCENYAPAVEQVYQQYKDQGLEVVWVLGATKDYAPPTLAQLEEFVQSKNVTFPVLRDYNFYQVYDAIDRVGTGLPHIYVLDATTMELIHKQDGPGDPAESLVIEMLTN